MFSNVDSKTATTMSLSILVGEYDVLNLSLGAMLTRSPSVSRRDAQRLQLAERERIPLGSASLVQPVPRRVDRALHGSPLLHSLRPLPERE
jgi:hypothetical protein